MKNRFHFGVVFLSLFSLDYIAATSQEETLSEYLWKRTVPLHVAALRSPFIQGLKKATLDPTNFGAYMVQDSVYCCEVERTLNLTASRMKSNTRLREFLQDRSSSYERYYKALYNHWHISDVSGVQIGTALGGYIRHLQTVSHDLDPEYLVVALIPCGRLWPWLGSEIEAKTGDFGVYTNWIKENLDPDTHGYKKYEHVINAAYKEGRIDKIKALEVYTRSMRGEVEFFKSV